MVPVYCGLSVINLPPWKETKLTLYSTEGDATSASLADTYTPSSALNKKVSLWCGDITRLEIDAIVNSVAKGQLQLSYSRDQPVGNVRSAVHYAAGPMLQRKCQSLSGYQSGEAVVTSGYNLPAKRELPCQSFVIKLSKYAGIIMIIVINLQ